MLCNMCCMVCDGTCHVYEIHVLYVLYGVILCTLPWYDITLQHGMVLNKRVAGYVMGRFSDVV